MEQFGKYELIRCLGSGGMAEVYLARTAVAEGLSKDLVIKKIQPAYARLSEFVSMFVTEAKIALGLNHPNIVQVFDFGTVDDTFFLAMEFVDGVDVLRMMKAVTAKKRTIPPTLCAHIVHDIAKGLDYAHRKTDELAQPLGIVHRDVSPHNVLVSWEGAVKLVDFGIARARGIEDPVGGVKGKYLYMSPEQARGEMVDRRSDIYSAGVVLFELCCGRRLFLGRGTKILDRVKTGSFPKPRAVNPQIPSTLEQIILRALSFHRDDRYATARDLQIALAEFLFDQAKSASDIQSSDELAAFLAELFPAPERHGPPSDRERTDLSEVMGLDSAAGQGAPIGSPAGADGELRPKAIGDANDDAIDDAIGEPLEDSGLLVAFDPDSPASSRSRMRGRKMREHKHVTVVELRLRGADTLAQDIGEDRAQRITAAFARAQRDIAFKHHGYVYQTSGERSTILIGLPLAGEDDASRAIRLGLALIEALDAILRDARTLRPGTRAMTVRDGETEAVSRTGQSRTGQSLTGLPSLGLSVGIQRGIAIIARGTRGNSAPTLLPAQTALASHLAEQADVGEIAVGSHVFRVAQRDWYFSELPPVILSGSNEGDGAEPITGPQQVIGVYRLTGAKERSDRLREDAARASELLGRDLELKALWDAYRDVLTTRRKRGVVVIGETGLGKRTLVNAFLAGIAPDEAVILRAIPQVNRAHAPYAVVADMARDMLGLSERSGPDATRDALIRLMPAIHAGQDISDEADRDMAVIARLLGTELGNIAARDIDPDELRQRLLQIMHRVELYVAPELPLILVMEDIHWADDESLDIFGEHLATAGKRPLLGILTTRPEPRATHFAHEVNAEVLRLSELDLDRTTELIGRRLTTSGSTPNPAEVSELAEQIYASTGGNPFFIREMIDNLIDRGALVMTDGMAEAPVQGPAEPGRNVAGTLAQSGPDFKPLPPELDVPSRPGPVRWVAQEPLSVVPSSVEALLSTRIDHLPEREKETLMRVSVLGRVFRSDSASRLLSRNAKPDLASLAERGLLRQADDHYAFHNDLYMTVAYGLLPAGERTRLHRLAAATVAQAPGFRPGPDDALIAHHLERAGDAEPAAARYLAAAAHAVDVGGNNDALRQLEHALELLPKSDHARRFAAHAQRREVLGRLARKDEQLRAIAHMREEAALLGDAAKLAVAHIKLADYYIGQGMLRTASDAVKDALERSREAGDALAEALALELAAQIARMTESSEEAIRLCDQGLALCSGAGNAVQRQRASLLNTRGSAAWSMSKLEDAVMSFAEALAIYRQLKLPRLEAVVINNLGMVCATMGEAEEALRYHKRALRLDQKLGDRAGFASKLSNIAQAYTELGDADRAERFVHKAVKLAEQLRDHATTAKAVITLGKVYWQRNDFKRAVVALEHGLSLAKKSCERYQEVRAAVYLAMSRLRLGHSPDAALELARVATETAASIPMPAGQIFGLAVQGIALDKMGHQRAACDMSAKAVALQAEQTRPEGAEMIFYFHAILCENAGRIEDATRAIEQAWREVEKKAGCIQDRELRGAYLSSKVPSAVSAAQKRLAGAENAGQIGSN